MLNGAPTLIFRSLKNAQTAPPKRENRLRNRVANAAPTERENRPRNRVANAPNERENRPKPPLNRSQTPPNRLPPKKNAPRFGDAARLAIFR